MATTLVPAANGWGSTWLRCAQCVAVISLAMLFVGCAHTVAEAKQNPLQAFGLLPSHLDESLIERAVVVANITLSDDVPFRFQLTWPESGLHPRFVFMTSARRDHPRLSVEHIGDEYRYRNAMAIPVYLVDDDRLGAHENAFVPDGCRCVLVNARSVDGILDAFGIGEKTQLLRYSEYERACVYATALLHEMGHLRDGDAGSYSEPAGVSSTDIISGFDSSTNKEIKADRFAVQQLRQALDAGDWRASPTGYPGRSNIANHVLNVLNVAVNTYDYRVDPWGALNGRRDLSSFAMRGYTHMNLQLRLLIMVYQLIPEPAKREHLSELLRDTLDRTFSPLPRQ